MIHRTVIGTDVAMLGIWDVQHIRTNLHEFSYEEVEETLRADAKGGRLFYVNTGADGECDVHLYVDEAIPADLHPFYKSLNRTFLLRCPSGRLVAGGLEEYMGAAGDTPDGMTPLQVPAGDYRLAFHELNEGDIHDPAHLADIIGADEHAYFLHRSGAPRLGCGLLIGGICLLVLGLGMGGLDFAGIDVASASKLSGTVVFGLGLALVLYRVWRNAMDSRYQAVKKRIDAYHAQFPLLLFSLSPLEGDEQLEGGWHTMGY